MGLMWVECSTKSSTQIIRGGEMDGSGGMQEVSYIMGWGSYIAVSELLICGMQGKFMSLEEEEWLQEVSSIGGVIFARFGWSIPPKTPPKFGPRKLHLNWVC